MRVGRRLVGVAMLLGGCRVDLSLGLQRLAVSDGGAADVLLDVSGGVMGDAPREDAAADVGAVRDGDVDAPAACAARQERCGGHCVDVRSDPAHCGSCGRTCTSDVCEAGVCGEAIRTVGIGDLHLCAVRLDGRVYCWGYNYRGQLGDGSTATRDAPTPVPGVTDAVDVVAGPQHTCALTRRDSLWCWGNNDRYQLGTRHSDANPHPHPELVERVGSVTTVGVGTGHTCVGRRDSRALCWGSGDRGQLGTGARGGPSIWGLYDDDPEPREVVGLDGVHTVVAGYEHSCALENGGSIWCWGLGELVGAEAVRGDRPAPVLVEAEGAFTQIAAGANHTCALRERDGTVWCWGSNQGGQLGVGLDQRASRVPVQVPDLRGVVQVAVAPGGSHTCARDGRDQVYCWGDNNLGQLGTGDRLPRERPVRVDLPRDEIRAIRAGLYVTCAVSTAGAELWCWGDNLGGNLGVGAPPSEPVVMSPRRVIGLR